MSIGERVHALLKKQGKKQCELASAIGAGISTISQWNKPNRNPSSEMILPLCEFFGCSVSYLLTGEESELPSMTDSDRELLRWLHMLDEKTQEYFLDSIKRYVKMQHGDLFEPDSISDVQDSQKGRMISSK